MLISALSKEVNKFSPSRNLMSSRKEEMPFQ